MEEVERYRRAVSYARGLDSERLTELVAHLQGLLSERRGEPDPEELITLVEAARLAGLALATLNTQRIRGKLVCEKRGRDWYLSRGELGRYLAGRDAQRGSYARRLSHMDSTETGE